MTSDELKAMRNEAGLTQEQLATKLKVAGSTIKNWEQGRTPIHYLTAEGIRSKLKYTGGGSGGDSDCLDG